MERTSQLPFLRSAAIVSVWHAPFVCFLVLFSEHQIGPSLLFLASAFGITRLIGTSFSTKKRFWLFWWIVVGWLLLGHVEHRLLSLVGVGLWSFFLAHALRDHLFLAPFSWSTQQRWCGNLLWIGSSIVTLQSLLTALQEVLGTILLPLHHPLLWGLSFPLLFTLALSPSPYARNGNRS